MSVEENVRKVEEVLEAFNSHDLSRLDRINARSIIFYAPGLSEPLKGRDAVRERNQTFVTAFPDLHFREERSFGQGDWVCAEVVATGTHKGPLLGPGGQMIPATNKPVRLKAAIIAKFEGGEQTEAHVYADNLELMTQLGLAP